MSLVIHAALLLVCGAATIPHHLQEEGETIPDEPLQIRYVARDPLTSPIRRSVERPLVERTSFDLSGALPFAELGDARTRLDRSLRHRPSRDEVLPSLEPSPQSSLPPRVERATSANPPPLARVTPPSPPPLLPAARLPVEMPILETDPTLVTAARPTYPERCIEARHEGTVEFELEIAFDGTVSKVTLIQSSGCRDLDRSAHRTAHGLRYAPATRGGQPITGTVRWRVNFELPRE